MKIGEFKNIIIRSQNMLIEIPLKDLTNMNIEKICLTILKSELMNF